MGEFFRSGEVGKLCGKTRESARRGGKVAEKSVKRWRNLSRDVCMENLGGEGGRLLNVNKAVGRY